MVSLTSTNRLRKLRKSADESQVTGAELSSRLVSHFAGAGGAGKSAGGGTPAWAMAPSLRAAARTEKRDRAKRRKVAVRQVERGRAAGDDDGADRVFGTTVDESMFQLDDMFSEFNPDASDSDAESDVEVVGTTGSSASLQALLSTTAPLTSSRASRGLLARDHLSVARLPNLAYTHSSVVSAVAFHPTAAVLVTAGLDKALRLAAVNGRDNPMLASVHFNNLPIHSLAVSPNGETALVTGRRAFGFEYHLETGAVTHIPRVLGVDDSILSSLERMHMSPDGRMVAFIGGSGNIVLVDAKTKSFIGTLKMNGTLRSLSWAGNDTIVSIGGDGVVFVWDVAARRCVAKWNDAGGFKNGAIAAHGDWLATGSYSGVVNVYRSTALTSSTTLSSNSGDGESLSDAYASMKLAKPVSNLTTPISRVLFNHDAQIMCMFSRAKKDALKMVHLPTCTVFANWPTVRTPLSYVQSVAFSPNGGMIAIGNDKGRVIVYGLKDYGRY
ncbi:WD40-repeat-containing domain protein [Blastocladiella britannica]|nr:WD40-repeat-containing domain protein [Blastocladiella britannica]